MPTAIGKYRVDGLVGEGAMGVVYLGHDPDLDRVVAIKTVHAHLISNYDQESWLERFAREARAAGRCMHGNLVTVFDYLQQGGAPHIVMEYVEADTLETRIKAQDLPQTTEILSIMSQMLAGLQAIHDAGIIHRDMKPANVLLTEAGTVKLADFGVARLSSIEQTGGGMIGTPSYMSPEQFAMTPVDVRADIYACGVIMYELISGLKPYSAPSIEELVLKIREGAPRPLSSLATGIPPGLDAIVRKALMTDREQRFADARSFRTAILDCFEEAAALPEGTRTRLTAPVDETAPAHGQTMLEQISEDSLVRIEKALITQIGPMGRVIARKVAASTNDIERMIDLLVAEIGDQGASQDLRRAIRKELTGAQTTTSGGISDEVLDRMTVLLTPILGPMARVLVKRTAAKVSSPEELSQSLATHIADERDRASFLRLAG